MNRYNFPIICLIAASVICTARAQETSTNDWHPNTKKLDDNAKHPFPGIGDAESTLAHDVKRFYQLLRDKKWRQTYELRAKVFREAVQESDYFAEAINAEKLWGLEIGRASCRERV